MFRRLRLEELGRGPGILAFPDHPRNATPRVILEAEGERGSRSGEIAFSDREDAAVRIVRISGEEKPGAGGADDADAADTTIERVRTPRLIQVTDDNDGAAGARGGLFQRRESMTEVLVAIATPSLAKIGNQRIEDDEGGVG